MFRNDSGSKVKMITVELEDGSVYTVKPTDPFLLLYDDGEVVQCIADLSPDFIQNLLIIGPVEQFAKQYERGELGDGEPN